MASAAADEEKGSPVVVGLLVVGNIIILVSHAPVLGSQVGVWWGGGGPEPGAGLRARDSPADLCSLKSEQPGSQPSSASPQLRDLGEEADFAFPPPPYL